MENFYDCHCECFYIDNNNNNNAEKMLNKSSKNAGMMMMTMMTIPTMLGQVGYI
jgi:hypothetical protein